MTVKYEKYSPETMKPALLSLLKAGKHNAIPGRLLADRLGEKDTRRIRRSILDIIHDDGIPVCGDASHGYFIAENPQECNDCLDQLMSYISNTRYHHKILLQASLKKFSGQIGLRL